MTLQRAKAKRQKKAGAEIPALHFVSAGMTGISVLVLDRLTSSLLKFFGEGEQFLYLLRQIFTMIMNVVGINEFYITSGIIMW